jgi:DNA repair exonuclease SbcCD ATPase subunit
MPAPNVPESLPIPLIPVPAPLDTTHPDPLLSSQLRADCEALRNDLAQAQELAGDFQAQLSGKSNEVAHFKQVLEKTQQNLERLQADILRLREERHGLANDVMRLQAIELQKAQITGERNRLAAELDSLRRGLAAGEEERTRRNRERGRQETILNLQVQVLRKQLQALRSTPGIPQRIAVCDPMVRSELEGLGSAVRELLGVLDEDAAARASALDPICGGPAVAMNFTRDEITVVAFDK